jgi:hypothetical protein
MTLITQTLLFQLAQLQSVQETISMPHEDVITDARPLKLCQLAQLAGAIVRATVTHVGDTVTIPASAQYLGGVLTKIQVDVDETFKGTPPNSLTVYVPGRVHGGKLLERVPVSDLVTNKTSAILFLVQTEGRWYVHAGGGFHWQTVTGGYRNELSQVEVARSDVVASLTPATAGSCTP